MHEGKNWRKKAKPIAQTQNYPSQKRLHDADFAKGKITQKTLLRRDTLVDVAGFSGQVGEKWKKKLC
jgi:hypothetical protein